MDELDTFIPKATTLDEINYVLSFKPRKFALIENFEHLELYNTLFGAVYSLHDGVYKADIVCFARATCGHLDYRVITDVKLDFDVQQLKLRSLDEFSKYLLLKRKGEKSSWVGNMKQVWRDFQIYQHEVRTLVYYHMYFLLHMLIVTCNCNITNSSVLIPNSSTRILNRENLAKAAKLYSELDSYVNVIRTLMKRLD